MNLFVASGRVGSDAEIRYTQTQMAVAGFSVAVDYGYGERKETVWIKCTLWGKRAEALSEYIRKGDMITVAGEIKLDQWESKGKSGANIALNVDKVTLGGAGSGQQRSDQQAHGGYQQAPGAQAATTGQQPNDMGDFDDGDIPF